MENHRVAATHRLLLKYTRPYFIMYVDDNVKEEIKREEKRGRSIELKGRHSYVKCSTTYNKFHAICRVAMDSGVNVFPFYWPYIATYFSIQLEDMHMFGIKRNVYEIMTVTGMIMGTRE